MWRYSALALLLLLGGCERYPSGGDIRVRSDMVDQPSFRPQRDPRLPAEGTVPSTGLEPAMTREQALKGFPNPLAGGTAEPGRKLYAIYCQHCHGASGRGDGPVSAKISKPANLTDQKYIDSPDSLIYYTMRYGSVIMPPLSEALASNERWQIVNYVRKLDRP